VQIVFVLEDDKAVARQVETGIQARTCSRSLGLEAGETVISGSYGRFPATSSIAPGSR